MEGLLFFLLGIIAGFITILYVLAASSLVFGYLLGLRPDFVIVSHITWFRMGDAWRKTTTGCTLSPLIMFSMAPPSGTWEIKTLRPYQALIPIGSLIAVILCFRAIPSHQKLLDGSHPMNSFLLGLATPHFSMFVIQLITLFKGIAKPESMTALIDSAKLSSMIRLPIRPREYDRDLVDRVLGLTSKNGNDVWRNIIAYSHFWDCGERERAFEILQAGLPLVTKQNLLPGNQRSYWFETAYGYAVLFRDQAAAEDAFQKAMKVGGNFAEHARFRALAAIKLLEGDVVGCRNAIDSAREEMLKLYGPDDPRIQSSPEWLGELEAECLRRYQKGG